MVGIGGDKAILFLLYVRIRGKIKFLKNKSHITAELNLL